MNQSISMIYAITNDNVLGYKNSLPIYCKEDLQNFASVTDEGILIMGRNTFESLPKNGLPGRDILVVGTKDIKTNIPHNGMFDCPVKAVKHAMTLDKPIWITGGSKIYKALSRFASSIYRTRFDCRFIDEDIDFSDVTFYEEDLRSMTYSATQSVVEGKVRKSQKPVIGTIEVLFMKDIFSSHFILVTNQDYMKGVYDMFDELGRFQEQNIVYPYAHSIIEDWSLLNNLHTHPLFSSPQNYYVCVPLEQLEKVRTSLRDQMIPDDVVSVI